MTVIGPALPHKWQSVESGREQYARGHIDGSVPVVGCSRFSCRADSGDCFDAVLSDDVGLHLEFGRRFFFFTVQRNATNEVSAESARMRTVTEVLMSSAEEQRLPEAPCTGPGGGQTAMDRLLSTFAAMTWDSRSTYVGKKKKKKKNRLTVFFCGMLSKLDNFFGAA